MKSTERLHLVLLDEKESEDRAELRKRFTKTSKELIDKIKAGREEIAKLKEKKPNDKKILSVQAEIVKLLRRREHIEKTLRTKLKG